MTSKIKQLMKNEKVFYNSKAIYDFLIKFGKGPNSKDYEFMLALLLKNFCEKQFDRKCEIGFELKPDALRKLPERASVSLTHVANIFRKSIKEDSVTDFIIATEEDPVTGRREELNFQVKRFGIGRTVKNTDEIIKFLGSLKYTKSRTSLLIVFDKGVEIEWSRVRDSIIPRDFPFDRLMFCWMEKGKVCIGEIYPQYGMEEYPLDDMIK